MWCCECRLDEMGALRWSLLTEQHQTWRLFTFPFLHGGLFHLLLNLSSILYVGVRLEREFGPSNSVFVSFSLVTSLFHPSILVNVSKNWFPATILFGVKICRVSRSQHDYNAIFVCDFLK